MHSVLSSRRVLLVLLLFGVLLIAYSWLSNSGIVSQRQLQLLRSASALLIPPGKSRRREASLIRKAAPLRNGIRPAARSTEKTSSTSAMQADKILGMGWLSPNASTVDPFESPTAPHGSAIKRLVLDQSKLQEDVLTGRVPLTRAIFFRCSKYQACAGLGDRMYGIVALYLAAVLTNRAFFIDITKPMDLTNFLVPNGVDWRIAGIRDGATRRKAQACSNGRPGQFNSCTWMMTLVPGYKCSHVIQQIFNSRPVVNMNSNHRTDCVQALLEHKNILPSLWKSDLGRDGPWWTSYISHLILRHLFKFHSNVVHMAATAFSHLPTSRFLIADCRVCVNAHAGQPTETARNNTSKDFSACAKTAEEVVVMSGKCRSHRPHWLVVGGVREDIDAVVQIAGNRAVVLPPNPSIALSVDLDKSGYADVHSVSQVFVEWYLLANCRYSVGSWSTFSGSASLMFGPQHQRFDVDRADAVARCTHQSIAGWQTDYTT